MRVRSLPLAAATDPKLETVTRGKVVYIEDNPANLQLMEHIVATLDGVEMISAPTAEIGIELTRARRPNLVLLDINLPGMSGVEAVRKMKVSKEIAAIPVVAVSAAAVKQEIDAALEAGMTLNQPRPRENSDKFHLSKMPDRTWSRCLSIVIVEHLTETLMATTRRFQERARHTIRPFP